MVESSSIGNDAPHAHLVFPLLATMAIVALGVRRRAPRSWGVVVLLVSSASLAVAPPWVWLYLDEPLGIGLCWWLGRLAAIAAAWWSRRGVPT